MKLIYRYTIQMNPVTKKNHQNIYKNKKTGVSFVAPSTQYKKYEAEAVKYLHPRPPNPIDRPVEVKCLFYMQTRRLCDLNNLLEAATDLLVYGGVLKDDNYHIVYSHDGSRVLYDKQNPRTEIIISEDIDQGEKEQ